jgi:hypothetical protein
VFCSGQFTATTVDSVDFGLTLVNPKIVDVCA